VTKADLRSHLITVRKAFVKKQNNPWHFDSPWPRPLMDLMSKAGCVAGYIYVGSEADVTSLLDDLATDGVRLALPYLGSRTADLAFRHYVKNDPLEIAPFGFRQPQADADIATCDVILTPLVGFDRQMARLGQGAGHYDRMFARQPQALRIGIAWSVQEVVAIPVDPWDIPLDAVLTEKEWIVGPKSRISR
jgi:5-formyltetrahydrofolate cyclo-ligase